MSTSTHKLYCYVDETGQDTMGRFFIVAIVVASNHRDDLQQLLEMIERDSGKKTKWMKTSDETRQAYIGAFLQDGLPARLYAKTYRSTAGSFDELTVLATAQAINLYREVNQLRDNYKVTVAIDGLSKTMAKRMGHSFRLLGIKIRNVHGERDNASPIIRLADAIAGLVREGEEGRAQYKALKKQLEGKQRLYEL